jgi:membrane fusion protein (multidrug efflux system)
LRKRYGSRMRLVALTTMLLCPLTICAAVWAQQPAAVPVATVEAAKQSVTRASEFVGRIESAGRVDIRARVTGYLQKVLFQEGTLVKEGDPLYLIEQDGFMAAEQQARGALFRAQASYALATVQRQRAEELVKTSATSRAQFDQQVAAEKGAQGEVVTADANLKTASINLGYTRIVAPITGEIGSTKVTVGNVVGPDSGPLTTLVSVDPMYVTFPVSQRIFLQVQRAEERRNVETELAVEIRFSDGTVYAEAGRINFVNVTVDRATDTVTVRATLPNPRGTLIDGQLVRVSVVTGKPEEKVLIPQAALIIDQQGPYVFLVVDGKAAIQRLRTGGPSGADVIVDDGLKGGEQVVVQGMETLRPGAAVIASPVPPPADRS